MSKTINDLDTDALHILVGRNVVRLRKKANMTQLGLSYEIGNKSLSLLSAAEVYKDKRHFNIAQLHKIAKALDVDIYEFFKQDT
jgi:transcriptional regulator with XRE-family HTH domain